MKGVALTGAGLALGSNLLAKLNAWAQDPKIYLPLISKSWALPTPTPTATPTTGPTPPPGDKSNVYRVDNCPVPTWAKDDVSAHHEGVDALLNLMGNHGLKFYKTANVSTLGGPNGMIAPDDLVLIKMNLQWNCRSMTNTDVIRGVIRRILDHPDGFTGEILIFDNGQGNEYLDASPGWNNDDYSEHDQSPNRVRELFSGFCQIGTKGLTSIYADEVSEYDAGGMSDGYVVTSAEYRAMNYPKFTTPGGKRLSFKYGIWNGSTYDESKVKLINIPVLKVHGFQEFRITAACKHYIGVPSKSIAGEGGKPSYEAWHGFFRGGGLGWALGVRYPDLNIVDATFVGKGNTSSWDAWEHRTLLASQDPVAVDYIGAKYILYQDHNAVPDPDDPGENYVNTLLACRDRLQSDYGITTHYGDDEINLISQSL